MTIKQVGNSILFFASTNMIETGNPGINKNYIYNSHGWFHTYIYLYYNLIKTRENHIVTQIFILY